MTELPSFVVMVSGLYSGVIFGTAIPTETERKIRGYVTGWSLFSNANLIGVLLNQLLWMLLIGTALTLVGIAILSLGDAYPLSQSDRYTLGISWFVGAGLEMARYLYWKRYDQYA